MLQRQLQLPGQGQSSHGKDSQPPEAVAVPQHNMARRSAPWKMQNWSTWISKSDHIWRGRMFLPARKCFYCRSKALYLKKIIPFKLLREGDLNKNALRGVLFWNNSFQTTLRFLSSSSQTQQRFHHSQLHSTCTALQVQVCSLSTGLTARELRRSPSWRPLLRGESVSNYRQGLHIVFPAPARTFFFTKNLKISPNRDQDCYWLPQQAAQSAMHILRPVICFEFSSIISC